MRLRDFAAPAIVGAVCLAVGWYLGGAQKREAAPIPLSNTGGGLAVSPPAVPAAACDSYDCAPAASDTEENAVIAAQPGLPTREQAAASMQAHAILDAAISRRVWTDDDAEAFTAYFDDLSPEEKLATLKKFTLAINQRQMRSDPDRMPF